MHIDLLGICGTFMGGLALIARQAGHQVSGADAGVYPPMSTQLEEQGIRCRSGYRAEDLRAAAPDQVIIGNALSRGNPAVEAVLEQGLPYTSGAQWLADHCLQGRWVLAVAGTHGKTTTASMLAWILEYAGLNPGFLIGGVAENFGISARLTDSPFFVIEADEYDTAFFDKRSKFVHYRPRTLILNNLEYDHADIFPDLAAIQRQFHHLVRTVPASGLIIHNASAPALEETLAQGCWSERSAFADARGWQAEATADGFRLLYAGQQQGQVRWAIPGAHNRDNALAALLAARHAGVPLAVGCAALTEFVGVKRRLQRRGEVGGVTVYDDFAHHPTAIRLTLDALREQIGGQRLIAVLEPRSNTMRLGVHKETLLPALDAADACFIFQAPEQPWEFPPHDAKTRIFHATDTLLAALVDELHSGDQVLIMSNGGFEQLHQRLLDALAAR